MVILHSIFIQLDQTVFCFELFPLNNESNFGGNDNVFIRLAWETSKNDNFKLYFNRSRNSLLF